MSEDIKFTEDEDYYIFEGNNRYSKFTFTKEEAIKYFLTIVGCLDCTDCTYCKYCDNCDNCISCEYCNNCKNCDYCDNCDGYDGLIYCDDYKSNKESP